MRFAACPPGHHPETPEARVCLAARDCLSRRARRTCLARTATTRGSTAATRRTRRAGESAPSPALEARARTCGRRAGEAHQPSHGQLQGRRRRRRDVPQLRIAPPPPERRSQGSRHPIYRESPESRYPRSEEGRRVSYEPPRKPMLLDRAIRAWPLDALNSYISRGGSRSGEEEEALVRAGNRIQKLRRSGRGDKRRGGKRSFHRVHGIGAGRAARAHG